MPVDLWDYMAESGNELQAWAKRTNLGVRDRARLNQKLDMLERNGFDVRLSFIAATSGDFNHIYKIRVTTDIQMRPMFCRGPADMHSEITLLCGAIEKGDKYEPPNAAAISEQRRLEISGNPRRRAAHERF